METHPPQRQLVDQLDVGVAVAVELLQEAE
jgi:hypothetical protein